MTARARTAADLSARVQAIRLHAQRLAQTVLSGAHGLRRTGAGEEFWQYRPYSPGDDVRRIDWRRTARSDRTLVREHEHHAPGRLFIWRDPSSRMDWSSAHGHPEKGFVADVLALALASVAARGGERIGALTAPPGLHGGAEAADHLLPHLARMSALPALPPQGSQVLILTDGLDPAAPWPLWLGRLKGLGAKGAVALIRDDAELSFPYEGDVLFEEPAQTGVRLNRAEAARAAYLERLEGITAGITRAAAGAGLETCSLNSRAPLADSFIRLCKMMGRMP